MREDARAKATRLLTEGRVIVKTVNQNVVVANVRGDSGHIYTVTGDARSGFVCPCQSVGPCSHALALALVTLLPLPLDGPGPNGP
jgi:uncharacterized Zn finger protein